MLGAKPSHNLANVWTESITRPGHLIPLPLILTPKSNRDIILTPVRQVHIKAYLVDALEEMGIAKQV